MLANSVEEQQYRSEIAAEIVAFEALILAKSRMALPSEWECHAQVGSLLFRGLGFYLAAYSYFGDGSATRSYFGDGSATRRWGRCYSGGWALIWWPTAILETGVSRAGRVTAIPGAGLLFGGHGAGMGVPSVPSARGPLQVRMLGFYLGAGGLFEGLDLPSAATPPPAQQLPHPPPSSPSP
eukprot:scaffold28181_cov62-Isochrysis_galbana.AAC.1